MKKFAIILTVVFGAGFLTSCDELFNELGMNIQSDYYETEFAIPPTDSGEYKLAESILTADLEEMLAEAGQDESSMINYVTLKSAVLTVMDESVVKDFGVIDEFYTFLTAPNVGEDTIASVINNGAIVSELGMQVSDVDVATYLEEDEFAYEIRGKLNAPLTDTLKIKAKIMFTINIQALNSLAAPQE